MESLRLEEGAAYTFVLWGGDPGRPRAEIHADVRRPAEQKETVRFYDYAIDPRSERVALFDDVRLHDFRTKPRDVDLEANKAGRITHSVAGKVATASHETRALGIVSVFSAGFVANDSLRLVVCDDDERAAGHLSACR